MKKNFMKGNRGITLIAMIITIIVMLVLAGVSMNAIVGDNGILNQAINATTATSIAVLQEYLQELYVENYDSLNAADSKVQALSGLSSYSSYFYNPKRDSGVGGLSYVVDSEGHSLYLINKSGLPEEIQNQLVGGDAGDGEYSDYASLNDVYGVTSNLEVYYCSSGLSSITGVASTDLDSDDPERTVFASGSAMASILSNYTDEDGNVTAETVRSVTSLTIDSDDNVSSLSELYNLTSLKELTLDGVTLSSLEGIQNVTSLNYLCFVNYGSTGSIGNYSLMSKLTDLQYLYLQYSNDSQVNSVFTAMKGTDYSKLQYLGVYNGTKNVTTVDILADLTSSTKTAVNYLYLYNNSLTDVSCVKDFSSVIEFYCYSNSIRTLTPACSNMTKLAILNANYNNLGTDESSEIKNSESDALAWITGKSSLKTLQLKHNSLIYTGYLSEFTSFDTLYLAENSNLNTDDLVSIKSIYWASSQRSIDSKYNLYLNTSDIISYASLGLTDDSTEIAALVNNENCIRLDLSGNSDLSNDRLQKVLSTMKNVQYLNLSGVYNLTSIAFVENMQELRELYIDNTSVTDLSPLETYCTKICTLTLKRYDTVNMSVSLSSITNTINNMEYNKNKYRNSNYRLGSYIGLCVLDDGIWETLSDCSELTNLYSWQAGTYFSATIDLSKTKLKSIYTYHVSGMTWIFPSTLENISIRWVANNPFLADGSRCTLVTTADFTDFAENSDKDYLMDSLKSLATFPNLQTVILTNCRGEITNSTNYDFVFSKVTSLTIYDGTTGVWDISGLSLRFPNLTTFKFKTPNEDITGFESISGLTNLVNLEIYSTKFSDLSVISGLSSLSSLVISKCKVSSCVPLIGNTSLTYIDLTNNILYSTSSSYNNCQILANLNPSANNGGQLTALYLSGNEYLTDSDYAYVKAYSWSGGSDF